MAHTGMNSSANTAAVRGSSPHDLHEILRRICQLQYNDEDHEAYLTKMRSIIPKLVSNYLTREQLDVEVAHTISTFLNHMAIHSPDVFQYEHHNILGVIFFRLMPLLHEEAYAIISEPVLETVSSLLHILQSIDLHTYCLMFEDLLCLLQDLIQVFHLLASNPVYTSSTQPLVGWQINSFLSFTNVFPCFLNEASIPKLPTHTLDDSTWAAHDHKRPYVLPLSSISQLIYAATNLVKLAHLELSKMSQFLMANQHDLYTIACGLVNIGPGSLKQAALQLLHSLFIYMPSAPGESLLVMQSLTALLAVPAELAYIHRSKEIDTELAHCLGVVTPRLSLEEFKVFAHPLVERIASAAYHTDCDWLQAVLCHILARSLQLRLVGAGSLTALLPPYPNAVTRASIVLCFMRAIVALDEPAPSAPMLSLSLQGPTSPRQLHGQVIELEAAPAHGSRASGPKGAEFLAALAYSARELMPPPDLHVKTTVSHSLQRLWMIALLCLKFGGNVDHVFSVATAWLRCSAAWLASLRPDAVDLFSAHNKAHYELLVAELTMIGELLESMSNELCSRLDEFLRTVLELICAVSAHIQNNRKLLLASSTDAVSELLDLALCRLCLLPPHFAVTRRSHVLISTLNSQAPLEQQCAIRWLPVYLARTKDSAPRTLAADSLAALQSLVAQGAVGDERLLNELASACGYVACATAGAYLTATRGEAVSDLDRILGTAAGAPSTERHSFIVKCQYCDAPLKPFSPTDATLESYEAPGCTGSLQSFEPFLALYRHENAAIRAAFVAKSLPRILRHMTPTDARTNSDALTALLEVLRDPEADVREAASCSIWVFASPALGPIFCDGATPLFAILHGVLHDEESLETMPFKETALETVGRLGCVVDGEPLLTILIALLDHVGHNELSLRGIAYERLRALADSHGCQTIAEVVDKFQEQLYCRLISSLLQRGKAFEETVTALFEVKECREFLETAAPIALPRLLIAGDGKLLDLLARSLGYADTPRMLLDEQKPYLPNCLLYLLTSADPEQLTKTFDFLRRVLDMKPSELFTTREADLLYKLFLLLGDQNPDRAGKAATGIKIVITAKNQALCTSSSASDHEMAEYLSKMFLGIMYFIQTTLSKEPAKRLPIVRSFSVLLERVQHNLKGLRPKVIATLKKLMAYPELQIEACRAWDTFVRRLDLKSLGSVLADVVVNLLPFVHLPDTVATVVGIFEYLLVTHLAHVREHLHEIPLLPDIPELELVRAHCQNNTNLQVDFKPRLTSLTAAVAHDNVEVRLSALTQLLQLLSLHRASINSCILDLDFADPTIERLLDTLLCTCNRSNDPRIAVLCAQCLGELGAIDPGRLAQGDGRMHSKPPAELEKDPFELAFELMTGPLLQMLRSGSIQMHDVAAFTIQSLLSYCRSAAASVSPTKASRRSPKKSASKPTTRFDRRWRELNSEIQALLTPFLESTYVLRNDKETPLEGELFTTMIQENSLSGTDWFVRWAKRLQYSARGDKVDVFRACSAAVKYLDTATILLPHMLLETIRFGSDRDRACILTELMSVLSYEPDGDRPGAAGVKVTPMAQMCTQTVFWLLDSLHAWIDKQSQPIPRERVRASRPSGSVSSIGTAPRDLDPSVGVVQQLIEQISHLTLATAALRCQAYSRAYYHAELHVRMCMQAGHPLDVALLQRCYSGIDEPDGFYGVLALQPVLSTEEQAIEFEKAGRWADAHAFYEQNLQKNPTCIKSRLGLLTCLKNLGYLETTLSLVTPSRSEPLIGFGIEAAWKLARWPELRQYLANCSDAEHRGEFDALFGSAMLALHNQDRERFNGDLYRARLHLMNSISASGIESYQRVYPLIVNLHMLHELEQSWMLSPAGFESEMEVEGVLDQRKAKLLREWNMRMEITQQRFRVREPLYHLQHAVLSQYSSGIDVDRCWLEVAKLARKENQLQTAQLAIIQASTVDSAMAVLEGAKLYAEQGDVRRAIKALDRKTKAMVEAGDKSDMALFARMELMLGKLRDQTGERSTEEMIEFYNRLNRRNQELLQEDTALMESGYFTLGKYYDKVLQAQLVSLNKDSAANAAIPAARSAARRRPNEPQQTPLVPSYITRVIDNYSFSLQFGPKHIYHSMPRLLTLWFDAANTCAPFTATHAQLVDQHLALASARLEKLEKRMPVFMWLVSFSQLLSRICHKDDHVALIVRRIITKVLSQYYQQAFWFIAAALESSFAPRKQAAERIIRDTKVSQQQNGTGEQFDRFYDAASRLCKELLNLCNKSLDKQRAPNKLTMSKDFRELSLMVNLPVIIPTQAALTARLPPSGKVTTTHAPFPRERVTIASYDDAIHVMASLQLPRRISIRGSDGQMYSFLCKPKDDLRKDARMMEFNGMINKLLRKDPEGRRRNLYIRTYGVIPLNEDSGIIEWVPQTSGLRAIIQSLYSQVGNDINIKEIKTMLSRGTRSDAYRTIFQKYPPIFHRWFLQSFRDPELWMRARLAFSRSAAVMSMVGSILGLGDRHCENILLDKQTGDCVHVDLNCLFWKGLTFQEPERVPFRLTPNLEDGLGITKAEGVFRRVCEISLRVLRSNRETLMSVLETLIYDPVVEWLPKKRNDNVADAEEMANREAIRTIGKVSDMLQGLQPGSVLPLSVEGQVDKLIEQAHNHDNLALMYIGWAPWL